MPSIPELLLETARKMLKRDPVDGAHRDALQLSFFSNSYRRWLAARLIDEFKEVLISDE